MMAKSTFDANNSAYEKYLENTFFNVPRSKHDLLASKVDLAITQPHS